jgi:hypothetical protein
MPLAVSSRESPALRVSVVIPVLDEEARIGAQLESLAPLPLHEVIVVDGGSRDATVARARAAGTARVLSAQRGRASQMNAGARAATGDVIRTLLLTFVKGLLESEQAVKDAPGAADLLRACRESPSRALRRRRPGLGVEEVLRRPAVSPSGACHLAPSSETGR